MGEYYIKKEGGKEVVYEKTDPLGLLGDRRVGELHKNFGGSRETRNSFGENVRLEPKDTGFFSNPHERRGSIDSQQGVFKRDTFLGFTTDRHPTFYPDPKRSSAKSGSGSSGESRSTSSYDYGGGYGGYSASHAHRPPSHSSAYDNTPAGIGMLIIALGLAIFSYFAPRPKQNEEAKNTRIQPYTSYTEERSYPQQLHLVPSVYPTVPVDTFRPELSGLPEARQPEHEYQPSYALPLSPPETYTPPRTYVQPYFPPAPAPEPYNPLAKTPKNVQTYIPPAGQQTQVQDPVYVVDTVFENPTDAYRSLLPSSPVARSAPPGYAPVVRETRNFVSGGTTQQVEYMPVTTMRADTIHELTMTYPRSGRRYTIERARYPEFYRRLDLNEDGVITLDEVGTWQYVFSEITRRHREGDMDAVVRDFMRNVLIVR